MSSKGKQLRIHSGRCASVGRIVTGLLISASAMPGIATAQETTEFIEDRTLDVITITANRREETLQTSAASIQALDGAALDRAGADGFGDYITTIPSVSFRDQGNGGTRIAIRGVSNVAGSDFGAATTVSTVGIYLNDIPIQGTSVLPDLALYDLNRVEVLKGPQGTLYGEGSLGGAVKLVLNEANHSEFEATSDFTISSTEEGGVNYRLRGAINVPLIEDRLALRAVGSYRNDEGFIDNDVLGQSDINDDEAYSIRAVLDARVTDWLDAEFLYLHDVLKRDEFPTLNPSIGDLRSDFSLDRQRDTEFNLYALTFDLDTPIATITSVSSLTQAELNQLVEFPEATAAFAQLVGPSTPEIGLRSDTDQETFAQEIRVVSKGDERIDWIVGGFFRDRENPAPATIAFQPSEAPIINGVLSQFPAPLNALLVPDDGVVFFSPITDEFTQVAVFGEVNVELIDGLEFTAGLRWYDEETTLTTASFGSSLLFSLTEPEQVFETDDTGIIPRFNLAYQATPDHLIYAQVAQGFRSGGNNTQAAFGAGEATFGSDTLWNYEIGAKTTWLDNRLTVNGAVYFTDWDDIQTAQTDLIDLAGTPTPINFIGNGGRAEIFGFELDATALVSESIVVGSSIGYNDGELVDPDAESGVVPGSSLPNTPELTASAFIEARHQIADFEGFARLQYRYTDDQNLRFVQINPVATGDDGFPVDSYSLVDLRVGIDGESFGVDFFIDNLTDERAQLGRGSISSSSISLPDFISVARPRTFGVTLRSRF